MKIAIAGHSGFIGTHLKSLLISKGHEIVPISRTLLLSENESQLIKTLSQCDAVFNLAGATINQRWNKKNKQIITDSRIKTTRQLVNAINRMDLKPSTFISASAVGIYPFNITADESYTQKGDNYLASVCSEWEYVASLINNEVRLINARFGVVLDNKEGALPQITLPFKFFAGAQIGSGKQGFPWIHISDATNALFHILITPEITGPVNISAPELINNMQFTKEVSTILKRPALFIIPRFILKILLGEREIMITQGQYVIPSVLIRNGFHFRFPTIKEALSDLLK